MSCLKLMLITEKGLKQSGLYANDIAAKLSLSHRHLQRSLIVSYNKGASAANCLKLALSAYLIWQSLFSLRFIAFVISDVSVLSKASFCELLNGISDTIF